jgi:hypothetical protein
MQTSIAITSLKFCLAVVVVSWLSTSCTDTSFSGQDTKEQKTPSTEKNESPNDAVPAGPKFGTVDVETISDPDPGNIDTEVNVPTETPSINDLVITAQEGRSVQACFSYDAVKMQALVASGRASHGHFCNEAVFNTLLSGAMVGTINLNNRSGYDSFTGSGGFGNSLSGPSVNGGSFGGRWINGVFDVEIQCALGHCHEDVTFLSIIGEVVTTGGKTMWLKIDQGMILPNQKYAYNFSSFQLSDIKPTFGTFCQLQ